MEQLREWAETRPLEEKAVIPSSDLIVDWIETSVDQDTSDDSGPGGDTLEAPWSEEQFDMVSRSRSTLVGTLDFVEGQRGG